MVSVSLAGQLQSRRRGSCVVLEARTRQSEKTDILLIHSRTASKQTALMTAENQSRPQETNPSAPHAVLLVRSRSDRTRLQVEVRKGGGRDRPLFTKLMARERRNLDCDCRTWPLFISSVSRRRRGSRPFDPAFSRALVGLQDPRPS
jgi:hypothetical protein